MQSDDGSPCIACWRCPLKLDFSAWLDWHCCLELRLPAERIQFRVWQIITNMNIMMMMMMVVLPVTEAWAHPEEALLHAGRPAGAPQSAMQKTSPSSSPPSPSSSPSSPSPSSSPEEGVMLNGTFPKLFATLLGTQPDIRFNISFQFHWTWTWNTESFIRQLPIWHYHCLDELLTL